MDLFFVANNKLQLFKDFPIAASLVHLNLPLS